MKMPCIHSKVCDQAYTDGSGLNFLSTESIDETTKKAIKIAKSIFLIIRTIFLLPLVALDLCINKGSIRFLNLSHTSSPLQEPVIHTSSQGKHLSFLEDPTESYQWKKEFVKNAKYSLEISGYCGGKPFQEFLKIIKDKLTENPDFKVRIITNSNMLNREDEDLYRLLMAEHPNHFEVVECYAVWTVFPKLERHENHTKMIIADQKYFIMGGTGVTNRLLKQGTVKAAGGNGAFLSNGNRDVDIAGEGAVAKILKDEFDLIWNKWKQLLGKKENLNLDSGGELSAVGMSERACISRFNSDTDVVCDVAFSHPEQGKQNLGVQTYTKLIDEARSTIRISNMVFNQKNIIQALNRAIKRGVNVEVITNGDTKKCSFASRTLGPRNRLHYEKLIRNSKKTNAGTCQIFEFQEPDILLHSKAMVIDEKTLLIGSFNISSESARCDDESLFIVQSDKLAKQAIEAFESFKRYSKQISEEKFNTLSFKWSKVKGHVLHFFLKDINN